MSRLIIDPEQIKQFAEALFPYLSDGQTISLRTYPEGDRGKKATAIEAVKINGAGLAPLIEAATRQAQFAADHSKPQVFCPPIGGFSNGAEPWRAREQDLGEGPALSVECDQSPAESRRKLEAVLGPATIVVESGGAWTDPTTGEIQPKVHLHWRLSEPAAGDALKTLKRARRLATALVGGDTSNVPIVHPIRWPGSWHRKLTPRMAQIVECRPDCEIDLDEALERLQLAAPADSKAEADGAKGDEQHDGDPRYTPELIDLITTGKSLHPALVPLAARLIGGGMLPGAAVNFLRALMKAIPKERWDFRCQSRFDSIPDIVSSAEAKFSQNKAKEVPEVDAPLTVSEWLDRDLPAPDFLMSELLSTTSRVMAVAPTGIGKTMFCLALAAHMAAGRDFLHWKARRPARVLYIDGEMSRRLLKARLADVVKRLGAVPEGLFVLSHEDIANFAPLNTSEGQAQIEAYIRRIGGVDFIHFDNIMSLVGGDQKDEEGWRQTLPWVRDLTRRGIGQLWIHHTGHDESRSYGTKTREWQLDTVIHLERVQRDDTDVAFLLSFRKARERTPDNRSDFQDVKVALVNDRWTHSAEAPASRKGRLSPMAAKFMDALNNVLASSATTTFQGWRAVKADDWQRECATLGVIDRQAKPDSARSMFSKYRRELVAAGHVACNGELTWKI